MGSITIKKNGQTQTYPLTYLDFERATETNTGNSGSTDLGSLAFVTDNILASGTLNAYIPSGAEDTFYVFKSTSILPGTLKGYEKLSEHTRRVLFLGSGEADNDIISLFYNPPPADLIPAANTTLDPMDPEQNCFAFGFNGGKTAFIPSFASGADPTQLLYNRHAVGVFETETGCTFGATMGAVPYSGGATLGVIVHSYSTLEAFGNEVSAWKATGNQPDDGLMPYGPSIEGNNIITYPSNGVDWTTHVNSETNWSIVFEDWELAKVKFDVTAEFVCTSINNKLYAGLAAVFWQNDAPKRVQVTLLPAWFWGAGSMDLTFDFDIPDYSDTWYGPDSSPNPGGAGGYIVRQTAAQIADVPARSYWSFIGQANAGTHCYLINGTALAKLQEALWNSLVTDEFKQYILSCIVALHQMPNELMPAPNASNAVSSIVIGNIPVPISGGAKAQIVNPFVSAYKVCSFSANDSKQSLGYFNGGNYLDYEPHVSVTLFLPFAGTLQISASQCIGGKIEVYVASNASNGDCVYTVVTTSDGKILKDADGNPVTNTYYLAGNSAMPIMISGTTTGHKQRQSDIYSMIGGAVTIATGAAAGNVGTVAHGALGVLEAKNDLDHIQQNAITAGGIAGSVAGLGQKQVILRVTRPVKAYDKSWIDLGGIRSEMSGKLEKAKTADSSSFTVVKFCNTSTLRATEAEKAEVLELLKGGVYL